MSQTPNPESPKEPVKEQAQPYYAYPGQRSLYPQPRRRNGIGCWIVGIVTMIIVAGLIIAGLFLPPVSLGDRLFGEQFTMLSAGSNGARTDDGAFALIVDPADPGIEFGVTLTSVSVNDFVARDVDAGDWIPAANSALAPNLALLSPVYSVDTTGTAPDSATLTLNMPSSASDTDIIDIYTWNEGDNDWRFAPSQLTGDGAIVVRVDDIPQHIAVFQASATAPIVQAVLDQGQTISADIANVATIISPSGMQPALPSTPQRTLIGNPAAGFETGGGYLAMPVIRNFTDPLITDTQTVESIIDNRELRDEHVQQLTLFASAGGYNGIFIDYRDLPSDQRDAYSAFIRALGTSLNARNLSLGVVVPPAENIDGRWETGAYDWREIGRYADYFEINFGLDPTTFAPGEDRLIEAMLRWSVGEVNRFKTLGALTARSIRQVSGEFSTIAYDSALAGLGNVQLEVEESVAGTVAPGSEIQISLDGSEAIPGVDTTIQSPFVDYLTTDGTLSTRMWLTTGDSLRFRLDRFAPFALGGAAFPDLMARGVTNSVLESILDYQLQLPGQPVDADLVLNWRIEGADGRVAEFTTDFNEDIVVTLQAPDGNYAVNVDVVGGDISSSRGGAAVALFAATPTPTPLPTSTPSPSPTPTPPLAVIVPTTGAPTGLPSGGGAPAVNPGPGSIAVGNFEYGGHVTSSGSDRAANAMRNAGMTWMKIQVGHSIGAGTQGAAQAINDAHARGFKVLVSLVGNPAQLGAAGADYIRQYASWAGDIAALGPDGIEIWNEPNLSREWPEGQISGGNYTALLRETYNTIKSRNGSVFVISAAPAPTGAEAAFPGRVVNDNTFLQQMVDAGALQFLDCVGLHYNEGIVGPTRTSGDPRDNYYTRYLPTLLDTYWNITGGQKPICITELGYLSSEGYGALPSFFNWAQNVTVAQQAAWLAEAAGYASQSGRVKLMIVWNVDFTRYDADPMAGYAIIRADGGCPACSALSGAR